MNGLKRFEALLVVCSFGQEITSTLPRYIFLIGLQYQEFSDKCLSEVDTDLSVAEIRHMTKTLESSKAAAKHIRSMPKSQSQAQVKQLRYERINFNQNEKRAKRENLHT